MQILRTNAMNIGYPKKTILENINLSIEKGRMVCLLGQNGVGKSTLIRTLANLQSPLSGEILLNGSSYQTIDRKSLARKLGIVTTERIGVSNMTVRDLVALGRYPYTGLWGRESKEDIDMIDQAIDTCKINYIKDSKLGEISDGQFQKAMIARVLAQDTEIILLDEPTAHLDVVNRHDIFQLLSKVKEEQNKALVISTHELDLSVKFSDNLWLMDYNAPIICGRTMELVNQGAVQKIFHIEGQEIDISHLLKK